MADAPLLSLRGLRVAYGASEVVCGVDLDVEPGETVALVGESGSGKTQTMLGALGLAGAGARVSGSARFAGVELVGASQATLNGLRGAAATMVFQEPATALHPLYRIGDQIAAPIRAHGAASRRQARARATALLAEAGLPDAARRLDAFPHQLSGGERQRVMIAMAIANAPKLIVADEPTTALDVVIAADILALFQRLARNRGMAMVFITHDLGIVRRIADRVVVMRDGRVVESGTRADVLNRPRAPYTRALVAAEAPPPRARTTGHGDILLSARGLTVDYAKRSLFGRGASRRALDGVSLDLKRGCTLAAVGESGSGKSTLARALLRLIPTQGAVSFEGRDISALSERALRPLRRRMQIVFQDPFASLSPRLSVGAIVAEGLAAHEPGMSAAERDEAAARALIEVGVDPASRHRTPDAFSGGQRQRIAIARALILKPSLVILDEPTSSLDRAIQRAVLDLLLALQASHALTYLFITHDLGVARAMADDVVVMRAGRVIEAGPAAEVFGAPRSAYARALIDAANPLTSDGNPGHSPTA